MDVLDHDPSASHVGVLVLLLREYRQLGLSYEWGLLGSLEADADSREERRKEIRREAFRLAATEVGTSYTRMRILKACRRVESLGRMVQKQLNVAVDAGTIETDYDRTTVTNGHFQLYSTQLFERLGQPTNIRFGTLRFQTGSSYEQDVGLQATSVELDLNSSSFVAKPNETHPLATSFGCFHIPESPSLINRGIRSRRPDAVDGGAFPEYDSWLLFTFLGQGFLKVEIPIEMCADVYGGNLRDEENVDLVFWGIFIEEDKAVR